VEGSVIRFIRLRNFEVASMRGILLSAAFLLLIPPSALADVVYLKSGSKMEGKVTDMGDYIILEAGSMRTTIKKEQIVRIEKKKSPTEEFEEKLRAVPKDDAEAFYKLGLWCLSKKLSGNATAMFEKAIAINPDHEGARRKLGYTRKGNRWVKPCYMCSGKGRIKCPVCRGTGFKRVLCPDCNKGRVICEACKGKGYFICDNCGGHGYFICKACGGTGSVYLGWPWGYGSCPVCDGKGKIDCPVCVGGRIPRKECKARGYQKCKTCNGKGFLRVKCDRCNGSKYLLCPLCRGKRFLTDEEMVRPLSGDETKTHQPGAAAQPPTR